MGAGSLKIIFSRKGFDSSAGGQPSPIFSDGRMVSLPIPDQMSPIRYTDIRWQEYNLGELVSQLTDGRIASDHPAHLDPDITYESLERRTEWRAIFGQTGSAQGHLERQDIRSGDLFLFFGLFRAAVESSGIPRQDTRSPRCHVIWGWLQIEEILKVDQCDRSHYSWAKYHPHFHRKPDPKNTLYVGRSSLSLPGLISREFPGAGVFSHFTERLMLTAPDVNTPSTWKLPPWFCPKEGQFPLTYHSNPARWKTRKDCTIVNTVGRGQEFILDTAGFPEAIEWLKTILSES